MAVAVALAVPVTTAVPLMNNKLGHLLSTELASYLIAYETLNTVKWHMKCPD